MGQIQAYFAAAVAVIGATLPCAGAEPGENGKHWAYAAPVAAAPPKVTDASWPANAIDRFIVARLEKEQIAPSPPADRERLVRRVSLDLVGLPPSVSEADAFLVDNTPDAYERLIDRLLASPRYGERWA